MGGDLRDAGDMVLLLSAMAAVLRFLRFGAVAADATAFAGAAGGGAIAGAASFVAADVWRRRLAVNSGARRRRLVAAAFGLAAAVPASMTVPASASVPEVCVLLLLLSLVLLCWLWVRDRVLQLLLLWLTSCGTKADALAFCGNISVLQNIKTYSDIVLGN